jgi:teichuronic acid biosynthesis glycosyltransferase TuaC
MIVLLNNGKAVTTLRVLTLSHMFPTPETRTQGVFIIEQMKALRKLGIEMKAIAPTPWAPPILNFLPNIRKYICVPKSANVEGIRVIYPRFIAFPGGRFLFLYGLFCYFACRHIVSKHVKEGRIDLIHAHTIMPDGFAALLLGREFKIPVVCTVHGSDISIYPHESQATLIVTKWALRRIKHLVAVSEDLGKKVNLLIGSREVKVIRNGADEELFHANSKMAARTLLGLPDKAKIVLFIGNLLRVKGPEYLLQAASHISSSDFLLYIVGDGMLRDNLLALAEDLGISARCVFVGARPHEEIASWLSAVDCLVLSSVSEGFPTIIAEAMMCGVPVVATAVGGIPEVVKHGSTGLLVQPRDPVSLGEAICSALQNDANIQIMVNRAGKAARAELTWEANARKTVEVYREALA